jgi:outer membrane protein assembly factor BamD
MNSKLVKFFREKAYKILPLLLLVTISGCGPKQDLTNKKPLEMDFDELEEKSKTSLDSGDQERSLKYLETLVAKYPDHPRVPEYKLHLAENNLKEGQFAAAFERYQQFGRLYPSHEKTEYAQYQAILAKFYQTLKISRDCDSSDTDTTLKLCNSYLANETLSSHRSDVSDILATCENRIVDKEIHVYNSYLRRGKYQSAQNRLDHLKSKYVAKDSSLKPRILYLECKLAQQQSKDDEAFKNLETLLNEFPESQFTRMAEGLLNKRAFALA